MLQQVGSAIGAVTKGVWMHALKPTQDDGHM